MESKVHRMHEAIGSGLCEVHEGSYQIIYWMQDHDLQVVTVVHKKQHLIRERLR